MERYLRLLCIHHELHQLLTWKQFSAQLSMVIYWELGGIVPSEGMTKIF